MFETTGNKSGKIASGVKKYILPAVSAFAVIAVLAVSLGDKEETSYAAEDAAATDCIVEEAMPAARDMDYAEGEYAGMLKFTVEADGESIDVLAAPGTQLGDALSNAGISYDEDDIISEDENSKIINGSVVTIKRVEYVRDTHVRSYDYKTEYREDETLPIGSEQTIVDGEEGEVVVETLSKVIDGETCDVEVVSKAITKRAVNRVVLMGCAAEVSAYNYAAEGEKEEDEATYNEEPEETSEPVQPAQDDEADNEPAAEEAAEQEEACEPEEAETSGNESESYNAEDEAETSEPAANAEEDVADDDIPEDITLDEPEIEQISKFDIPDYVSFDENGVPKNYIKTFTGKSCAYTAEPDALMSTGKTVYQGYVAVDDDLIPYGSELFIVADDGTVYGYAIAADTGYSVRAGDIVVDLFMDTYDDCVNWGARNVTIYVLSE